MNVARSTFVQEGLRAHSPCTVAVLLAGFVRDGVGSDDDTLQQLINGLAVPQARWKRVRVTLPNSVRRDSP